LRAHSLPSTHSPLFSSCSADPRHLHSFPTRRSSDLERGWLNPPHKSHLCAACGTIWRPADVETEGVAAIQSKGQHDTWIPPTRRSEEHTSELQSLRHLVCRLLLEKKKKKIIKT